MFAGGRQPLFDFVQSRLADADGDGWPEYYPQDSPGKPYVYFRNQNYLNAYVQFDKIADLPEKERARQNNYVRPYLRELTPQGAPKTFAEPEKFQIVCAGQDGDFGKGGGIYPDGVGYADGDQDNLTNFAEGKTLEDAIP
jgi:hypothetical protein